MMKILVVEDEDDIRTNLQRLLRIEGYEVETARNGRIGLELARTIAPALILSDVMMPELDGFGLVEALREDPQTQQIPVILLTARADRADVRQGMNLGADDYLTKPFQRDELLSAVRSRLERAAAQREATERLAREARRLMHYDSTTNLPNRTLFLTLLESAVSAAQRLGDHIAILRISLDQLDLVSQNLGREGTADVLREMARRLESRVTQATFANRLDAVGIFGDGEFTVLLNEFADADYVLSTGESLLDEIRQPLCAKGGDIFISASIGFAVFPDNGGSGDELIAHAEVAAGVARRDGGNRLVAFSADMTADTSERLRLHNDLHRALGNRELDVYYQPQLAADGRAVGFEALIRWRHPELGFVSPLKFIPIAENNRQIIPIGAWVLQTACRQVRLWRDAGFGDIRVAVNLSARQFGDPALLDTIEGAIAEAGIAPDGLEIEITEGTAMQNAGHTVALLERLKERGLTIAIDDFGTGYSSLSYLKRFPLDILKIDQSFVRNIHTDRDDRAIATAVSSLAHSLGLKVVAEGVETEEHRAILGTLGVDYYQGYLYGKPMPAADATEWLTRAAGSVA
jgi:diguanylate cyclase